MIAPLQPSVRVAEAWGTVGRELKRWLDLVAAAVSSTYVGDQLPGRHVYVGTGQFAIHAGDLVLKGTESLVLESDSVLVVL